MPRYAPGVLLLAEIAYRYRFVEDGADQLPTLLPEEKCHESHEEFVANEFEEIVVRAAEPAFEVLWQVVPLEYPAKRAIASESFIPAIISAIFENSAAGSCVSPMAEIRSSTVPLSLLQRQSYPIPGAP
jgi:hypothetical protein